MITRLLAEHQPSIIFFPHDDDWNQTHLGVHHLLVEALAASGLACLTVETEFWGAMDAPNFMVESSAADVADLSGRALPACGRGRTQCPTTCVCRLG